MLRLTLACLLLVGSACSKAKKENTACPGGMNPRTGACVTVEDPDTAALRVRLDAQNKQILDLIAQDRAKEAQLRKVQAILNDPNATETQKEKVVRELGDIGIKVAVEAGASVAGALLQGLNEALGTLEPTPGSGTPP